MAIYPNIRPGVLYSDESLHGLLGSRGERSFILRALESTSNCLRAVAVQMSFKCFWLMGAWLVGWLFWV